MAKKKGNSSEETEETFEQDIDSDDDQPRQEDDDESSKPTKPKKTKEPKDKKVKSIFDNLKAITKNPLALVASDDNNSGYKNPHIDTQSLLLNALVSGSLNGGFPGNHLTALAGPPGSGKSFLAMAAARKFLQDHPDGRVIYVETEGAVFKETLEQFNIDTSRVYFIPVGTVESFRHQISNVLKAYEDNEESTPVLLILDSMGMLSTNKETKDALEDADKKDMTRAQLLKSVFRIITLKLRQLLIPMIFTNHTYAVPGCLDGGQGILMSDDTLKPIARIEIGDRVKTLSRYGTVDATYEYFAPVYELELSNGDRIKCTGGHRFMTSRGDWKTVNDLQEGDDILAL